MSASLANMNLRIIAAGLIIDARHTARSTQYLTPNQLRDRLNHLADDLEAALRAANTAMDEEAFGAR